MAYSTLRGERGTGTRVMGFLTCLDTYTKTWDIEMILKTVCTASGQDVALDRGTCLSSGIMHYFGFQRLLNSGNQRKPA